MRESVSLCLSNGGEYLLYDLRTIHTLTDLSHRSFGQLEWFPLASVPSDDHGDFQLYSSFPISSRYFFKKYPESKDGTAPRTFMDTGRNSTEWNEDNVLRLTKLFTIYEHPEPDSNKLPSINSFESLGVYCKSVLYERQLLTLVRYRCTNRVENAVGKRRCYDSRADLEILGDLR
jgi:hypothetical protein